LVAWSAVPVRRHPLTQAALASVLIVITKAPLGLRPPALGAGLRLGGYAASVVVVAVAASTGIPRVRASMAARELPDNPVSWVGVKIPIGTVWSEEAAYRGALKTLASDGFGRRTGRLVQATAFGLSHIPDARESGEPVLGTVIATGAAGLVFDWLAERSGSLAAAMLAHLAINEAGAAAALCVQSKKGGIRGEH
jgi:membrane protease YdiL (CAAX protease family)